MNERAARGNTAEHLVVGDIPATWSQPAESLSPMRAGDARVGATSWMLAIAVLLMCAAALWLWRATARGPAHPATTAPSFVALTARAPAPPRASPAADAFDAGVVVAVAASLASIPVPPPTSSTTPSTAAPEDEGGSVEQAGDVVLELPARKKATRMVLRAQKLLLADDAAAAEPLLKRAAALDPSYPDAWRNLGIARARRGDLTGARIAYKKYVRLAPAAPDAADVRRILSQQ